jgi:hypothetical protein
MTAIEIDKYELIELCRAERTATDQAAERID